MNRATTMLATLVAGWAGLLLQTAVAGHHGCSHCGCDNGMRKVCKLVVEEKSVKETCYDCECEDYCLPGPSCKCGKETINCECGAECPPKCITTWQPAECGDVRTRTKLIKKEITRKVPTYKWVVETVCDNCGNCCNSCGDGGGCSSAAPAGDAPMPPQPQPAPPTAERKQKKSRFVLPVIFQQQE